MSTEKQTVTIEVVAARVQRAFWDKETCGYRTKDGDIAAAYSADHIAEGKSIRPPFHFRQHLWVTVGTGPGDQCKAYYLLHEKLFAGKPTTYKEKTRYGDDGEMPARQDPMGFYHGMRVKHGKEFYVMVGPECRFIPENQVTQEEPVKAEQLGLFE